MIRPRPAAVAGVLLLGAFLALGVLVRDRPPALDRAVADALHGQWREPVGAVTAVLSDAVFGPLLPVLLAGVLLVAAWVLWRRGRRANAALLLRIWVLLALCRLTSFVFKPIYLRDRPRVFPDFAYPSGHVVSVASTGFALVVLCAWLAPRLLRWVAWIAVLATALSAACRIVLGVHWVSDTVGAVLAVTGVGLLGCLPLRLLPSQAGELSAARKAA
ncbi:phosphatase PAP2 family protein [Amycolatopsis cihanbeyliensis]|uniref:Undecaprenyl-diphosphatase n=1 Tax=Amycolatopsis cihanbeyliensis TaxID=1128664 RepID=A0A542DGJ2_AMYCI|nr:phosphatase PAP2 family protein [Amycolatopsis cihanbeyliensis]TQJ02174.1 undecaprenyl-diphosphatase [Amycolatopsis cihanbeyliensis]